jgi:hypothetical protein
MKILFVVGVVVLVLGILSFFVPIPHSENHALKAGDVSIGVRTEHSERVPPTASVVMVVAGAGMMIAARGRT